jgi:hypothetical protein
LLKTEHIRMIEEILEISPLKVRVKYRFFNESDQDIHTTVAFPLPPENRVSRWYVDGGDPDAILATFKVLVDGKPVAKELVRKAVLGDRDITDQLRKLGLSDKEIFLDWIPKDEPNLLDKLEGFRKRFGDWWRISQTLFWQMTFPAKKETVVEHEYAPATGAGWAGPYNRENFNADTAHLWSSFTGKSDSRKDEDCPDETTKRAIENRVRMAMSKGVEAVSVKYSSVEYILGTGRNWKGPIGEFRLRLVKEKPDQFVSLCFPGQPEKTSPTVYEFYKKDFVPQDTLVVYFYTVDPG